MDAVLVEQVKKYCVRIEDALAIGDISLANTLISERLTALQSLEASVNKSDEQQFYEFRELLLQIEKDDSEQLEQIQNERRKLHSILHKQTKTSQAVSAYAKIKYQK